MGEVEAVCLLAESNAWDSQRKDVWFNSTGERFLELTFQLGGKTTATRSKSRRKFCIAKVETGCTLMADTGLLEGQWVVTHWQSGGSPSFFFINEVALGSLVTLQLQMTPTEVKLCYKREVDAQPVPQSQKMSLPRSFGGESPAQCLEPLLLVCDSNDWTPDARFHFTICAPPGSGCVRHQLRVKLAKPSESDSQGNALPVSWQFAFVPLSFQVLSVRELWSWRIVPVAPTGDTWQSGNLLRRCLDPAVVVQGPGQELHGRDFHLLEPHGTVLLINVELKAPNGNLEASIWYENSEGSACLVADKRPATQENILAALQWSRDLSIDAARALWEEGLRARCPAWWRNWAQRERRCEKRVAWMSKHLPTSTHGLHDDGSPTPSTSKTTKDEALQLLDQLTAALEKHQALLSSCRRESTVKLSLTEDFQFMPPKAIQLIGTLVEEEVVARGHDLHGLWSALAPHLATAELRAALGRLRRSLEGEPGAKPRRQRQLAVQSQGGQIAACGTKLVAGMRVMLRWRPGSVGATHLAYLNGHVGILNSWDGGSQRWQVGFESFDGHLDVSAENLQLCSEKPEGHMQREELQCEMCLGHFLEAQLMTLPCPDHHGYCQTCLRKWVLTQLVPRCYKCLDELGVLTLPQGATEPWCGVVTGEAEASSAYRISKEDVEQLQCICCFQVSCGARCVIIGYPGLVGERCTVGRVEKTKTSSFAVVYLSNGCRKELDLGCLVVDDCLSSGRQARGEACTSKTERLGLGLSVASLGCACVVKQAMDEMFVEQLAMPFDWLVSRVEGLIYFLRHGFRDFSHYDDVKVVGEHGYTSYRSAYHAFPHHDLSASGAKDAFARRGARLLELIRAGREGGSRPLLLIRVCARSEELEQSEELYHLLKLMGGQKLFLLVVITEQVQYLGAVQHIKHSNLILYVCKPGCSDLVDAVRFGMDYVYAAVSFGRHAVEDAAGRVSPASPVPEAQTLRQMLRAHRHWLTRDRRGLSPTSDIDGCFENGPGAFFPGRFKGSEASPYYSQQLEKLVLSASASDVMDFLTARPDAVDVNAWRGNGETVLFVAARQDDAAVLAALLLAAADPNCRARDGRRALQHGENRAVKALLRSAAGDSIRMTETVEALEAVPEPLRRQLCGLLGLFTAPELWAPGTAGASSPVASSAQLLWSPPLAQQFSACGATEALQVLQRGAGRALEERRQIFRRLLRSWHPDKHHASRDQSKANEIFCFIQKLRDVFLQEGST